MVVSNRDEFPDEAPPPTRLGYPLSSMFLLVGLCGLFLAMTAPYISEEQLSDDLVEMLWSVLPGAIIAGIVGGIMGLSHVNRWRGALCGVVVGGMIGAVLLPWLFFSDGKVSNRGIQILRGFGMLVVIGLLTLMFRSRKPR